MSDINKVLIVGCITKDPELRYTPKGTKTVDLRIAVHYRYKTQEGLTKEDIQFFTIVAWEHLAELCAKYLKKGRRIFVEGRLQNKKYIDKNQQQRTITEIRASEVNFLDKPKKIESISDVPKIQDVIEFADNEEGKNVVL